MATKDAPSQGHRSWLVARIWALIVHTRIQNLHGDISARLDRKQILYHEESNTLTLRLLQWFSFLFLFNAPNAHHFELQKLWLDNIVYREAWRKMADALIQEWTETSLLATVLWTADMAFLAVNNINTSAQLGSLISTALALASIITAILQIRRHRGRTNAESLDVAFYLIRVERRRTGLFPLAINYSLPYVLFIWSISWFGAAILLFSIRFWPTITGKSTIFGMIAAVLIPIGCTYFFAWDPHFDFMPRWRDIRAWVSQLKLFRERICDPVKDQADSQSLASSDGSTRPPSRPGFLSARLHSLRSYSKRAEAGAV